MNLSETRLQDALDAAMGQIQTTAAAVADRVCELLSTMAESSTRIVERDLMLASRLDLVRNIAAFHGAFRDVLHTRVGDEVAPRGSQRRPLAVTDWESLSLVNDQEVEERMAAERIAQQISQECETELRELNAYMRSLLRGAHLDDSRNPLRPEVIGAALNSAIEATTDQADMRRLLARDVGRTMARAMPVCYAEIVRDLKARGVQPQHMTVRSVEGPGNLLTGMNSGYSTAGREWHSTGNTGAEFQGSTAGAAGPASGGHGPGGYGPGATGAGSHAGGAFGAGTPGPGMPGGPAAHGRGPAGSIPRGASPAGRHGPADSRPMTLSEQADLQLMALLRRLTAMASRNDSLESMAQGAVAADSSLGTLSGGPSGMGALPPMADTAPAAMLPGLMAVNLIRAHREELRQAAGGRLDHMVIDVVGSLFDQILSDARVPPQMARQIARLQLPVLRVALSDSTFFSSRRHPVRRFVNRMASLACAFEDFEEGPGMEFITRVRELVQEIVDGDFDQIDVYTAKLVDLESFIATQSRDIVQRSGAATTFEAKETELRLQQRYTLQLQAALAPLSLPAYLREFLSQVWSQAVVLACARDGADSERAQRYRRVGRELVMSVQPKGSPTLRKKFLMQLPPLMKDLYEGMKLIGWPEPAQKEFFAKLLPAHAEALKQPPQSELDHNMLVKQLDAVFGQPMPRRETVSSAEQIPQLPEGVVERRFTPEEAKAVGLVEEAEVNWSDKVEVDVAAPAAGGNAAGSVEAGGPGDTVALPVSVDINLDMAPTDVAEPASGAKLMDHIQLGFAYQMHLKDKWQKVRLTYMSPGRSFFVFSRGKRYQETISMTARMLSRMCETGRLRAFENAYLMERATQRARRQLAAMKTAPSRH